MTLQEFGETLRQAREHRNLSQDDIAVRLKLTSAIVQSIEAGNLEGLPHLVYARGFIKAYASIMEIPADTTHEVLASLKERKEDEDIEPVRTRKDWMPSDSPFSFSIGKVLGLAVLAALFVVFWFGRPLLNRINIAWPDLSLEKTDLSSMLKEEPKPAPQPVRESEKDTQATLQAQVASSTQTTLPATPQPASPQEASGTASVQANTNTAAAPLQQEAQESTPPPMAPREHVLVISATRADCWISIRPSNGPKKDMLLKKGEQFTLKFEEKTTLRFGNLGGVDLAYDGKKFTPQEKRVKNLTFPPEE